MEAQVQQHLKKIAKAHKSGNSEKLEAELAYLTDVMKSKSESEKTEVSNALLNYIKSDLPNFESMVVAYKTRKNATKLMINNQEFDMREWATISQYAKLQGYASTNVISNQIRRGKIDKSNIAYIPELDIKLIKIT